MEEGVRSRAAPRVPTSSRRAPRARRSARKSRDGGTLSSRSRLQRLQGRRPGRNRAVGALSPTALARGCTSRGKAGAPTGLSEGRCGPLAPIVRTLIDGSSGGALRSAAPKGRLLSLARGAGAGRDQPRLRGGRSALQRGGYDSPVHSRDGTGHRSPSHSTQRCRSKSYTTPWFMPQPNSVTWSRRPSVAVRPSRA